MNKFDFDVIMLSDSKNEELFNITANSIKTLFESSPNVNINLILVENHYNLKNESYYKEIPYNFKLYLTDEPFGYNKFLQIGYKNIKSDAPHIMILNNDIICYNNFLSILKDKLKIYDSVSPADPYLINNINFPEMNLKDDILGYRISTILCGWCIAFNKYILDKIPFNQLFPERYKFWYSDNYYGYMLQKNKFKHALIPTSFVHHLTSKTLETVGISKYYDYTIKTFDIYDNDIKNNMTK